MTTTPYILLLLLSFCFLSISVPLPLPRFIFFFFFFFYPLFMFCVHIFRHGRMRDRGVDSHDRLDSELSRNTRTNTIATFVNGSELFVPWHVDEWINTQPLRRLTSSSIRFSFVPWNESNQKKLITISPGHTNATDEHIAMWFHCESVTLPVSFESVRFSNNSPVNATKRTTTKTTTTTWTIFPLHRSHTTVHFGTVCWAWYFFSGTIFHRRV